MMARTSRRTMTMIAMTMLPDILAVGGWRTWVEWLTGSEACVWRCVYVLLLCETSDLVVKVIVIQQ